MYSDDLKTTFYLHITCKIGRQPLSVVLGLEEFSKKIPKESVIRGFYSALNSVLIVGYKSNTQELHTNCLLVLPALDQNVKKMLNY